MSRGNVPLGASILPMNLLLPILLLPVYLWLFMGDAVAFVPSQVLVSIVLVSVVPLTIANTVKRLFKKAGHTDSITVFMGRQGDNLQLLFLCLAVAAIFGLATFADSRLRMPFADRVSLLFTTLARNSPVSLAIATIAQPLISLALVIGHLIELPILAIETNLVRRIEGSLKRISE
jgi:ACR3 family arsenite efflux pump ArsB